MNESFEFDQSLRETLAALDQLPARIEANLVRGALRAAAKPIFEDARAAAPVVTGRLRDSIRISTGIKRRDGEIVAAVKAGGKQAYYAHMVEYGTTRHIIKGPVVLGGQVFKNVEHTGSEPRSFMRKAFDNSGQASVDAYAEYFRRNLDRAIAKNAALMGGES